MLPGVPWGSVDAFPTPAYWLYQVHCNRLAGSQARFRLGRSLAEEVGACLLGGHGMPASVGIAAFEHVRARGAFGRKVPKDAQLLTWLREPLEVGGRRVRYRFADQKARYLAGALSALKDAPAFTSGRALRDWLLGLPGIGYKTASWVARNWLGADDVAILDIHIYRFGAAVGLFSPGLTVDRHYLELEERFLAFSRAVGVRASEVDAVIWYEMSKSPLSVRELLRTQRNFTEERAPEGALKRRLLTTTASAQVSG